MKTVHIDSMYLLLVSYSRYWLQDIENADTEKLCNSSGSSGRFHVSNGKSLKDWDVCDNKYLN